MLEKVIKPLTLLVGMEIVWRLLKKLRTIISPCNVTPGHMPGETIIRKDICTPMFTQQCCLQQARHGRATHPSQRDRGRSCGTHLCKEHGPCCASSAMGFSRKNTEGVACFRQGSSCNTGIEPRSPTLIASHTKEYYSAIKE